MANQKTKTHKWMAKRIKVTASGKFKFKKTWTRHLRVRKWKSTRTDRYGRIIHPSDVRKVKNLLPYSG